MAQRQAFRIVDFSGGYNPDQEPHNIADNEAAYIKNIRLDKKNSLVSRHGYSKFQGLTHTANLMAVGRWSDESDPQPLEALGGPWLVPVARSRAVHAAAGPARRAAVERRRTR